MHTSEFPKHLVLICKRHISAALEKLATALASICLFNISPIMSEQRPAQVHRDTSYKRHKLCELLITPKIFGDINCL